MAVAMLGRRDAIVRMAMAVAVIVRVRCCHDECRRKLEAAGEQVRERREKCHGFRTPLYGLEALKISEIVDSHTVSVTPQLGEQEQDRRNGAAKCARYT